MSYPKKFLIYEDISLTVVQVATVWGPETNFIPTQGYRMVEVPMDSPIDVGWRQIANPETDQLEWKPPK